MKKIKSIRRPDSTEARPMKPADLNKLRFSAGRTVLTPELLEKMSQAKTKIKEA